MGKEPMKKRKAPASVTINANVRCQRIYPVEDTMKKIIGLKTVGIRLTKDQAIHLARVLLAVAQDWDEIDITAYRFDRRKRDGTYHVTVTSSCA